MGFKGSFRTSSFTFRVLSWAMVIASAGLTFNTDAAWYRYFIFCVIMIFVLFFAENIPGRFTEDNIYSMDDIKVIPEIAKPQLMQLYEYIKKQGGNGK